MTSPKAEQIIVLPQGLDKDEVRVGSLILSLPDIRKAATMFPNHIGMEVRKQNGKVQDYSFSAEDSGNYGFGLGGLFFLKRLRETMQSLRVTGEMEISSMCYQSGVSLDVLNDKSVQDWFHKEALNHNSIKLFMLLETYTLLNGTTWRNGVVQKGFSGNIQIPLSAAAGPSAPLLSSLVDPKIEVDLGKKSVVGADKGVKGGEMTADVPLIVAIRAAEVKIKTESGFKPFSFGVRGPAPATTVLEEYDDEEKQYALGSVFLNGEAGTLLKSEEGHAELLLAPTG